MENSNKDIYKVDEHNKIYIIGGRGVGKTTLLYQIHSGKYDESITPSEIGMIKSQYKTGKKEFTIKDLTDDDNFTITNVLKNELEDIILIFIIFAINDKDSFQHAKTLIQFIKNNLINNKELNIILVGNKYDLEQDNPKEIQVQKKEIDQYIYNIDNLYYYQISCKNNYNISKIKELIDEIEIEEEKDDEDDDKIPEEERKQKVEEAKQKSCIVY